MEPTTPPPPLSDRAKVLSDKVWIFFYSVQINELVFMVFSIYTFFVGFTNIIESNVYNCYNVYYSLTFALSHKHMLFLHAEVFEKVSRLG